MATVKLGDVIDVEIYEGIQPENNPEQTIFFESGIIVRDADLDAKAMVDTNIVNAPFWRDLDPNDEPEYDSDSDDRSTPSKIVQGQMKAKRAHMNKSWAARDLTANFTMGEDPMTRIRNRTGKWWQWQSQFRLLAITQGVYNANVAGNITAGFGSAGDMILDVTTGGTLAVTAATQFTYEALVDAELTMGERANELNTMLLHPVIYARLKKNNDIEFRQDSTHDEIPVYAGYRVVVSKRAPVITGGTALRYITCLFGPAAFGFGVGRAETPIEIDRDPSIGTGGGEDILYERAVWLFHPYGHSNLDAVNSVGGATAALNTAGNGLSQNYADLRLAANWERTHFRENVPMTFLVTY